uniref:Uncharacterized protein n=1 Tax=Solanum lycopersicum TaxID=4081 RepID=A0A3Q7I1U0_SOLLC
MGLVNKEKSESILRCWFKYYNSKGVRKHFSLLSLKYRAFVHIMIIDKNSNYL